ncbi:MAG: TolC family protein [Planctomycetes bacterium]|nr:TolC family protein [Planctomycetota bacterium]
MSRAAAVSVILVIALVPGCGLPTHAIADRQADAWREAQARVRGSDGIAVSVDDLLADGLSAHDAVQIALHHSRTVPAILAQLGVDAAAWVTASRLRNPSLHADALFFGDGTEVEVGMLAPLLDSLQQPLREAQAEQELLAAEATATRAIVAVAFATRRAFVDLLVAGQRARLADEGATAAAAAATFAQQLAAAGNAAPEMLAQVLAAHADAELRAAEAADAILPRREVLQRQLGLFGPRTAWQTQGELPADPMAGIDLDAIETRAVQRSLELRVANARLAAAHQASAWTDRATLLPGSEVGISAMRESDGEAALGPALRLELPLFDGGGAARTGAAAATGLAAARLWQLGIDVRSAARLLRDRLRGAANRLQFAREVAVPAAQRATTATLQRYNAMQVGAFDVIAARQRELATSDRELTTLAEAWQLRLQLEELLAGALPELSPSAATGATSHPSTAGVHR